MLTFVLPAEKRLVISFWTFFHEVIISSEKIILWREKEHCVILLRIHFMRSLRLVYLQFVTHYNVI